MTVLRVPPAAVLLLLVAMLACDRGSAPAAGSAGKIRLGFIVKQPEEPWFQLEWKFADAAAAQHGFELIKIGATDGEKVLAAIDNLAASGAQGFVICTPDVRLGPAIVARATSHALKVIAVDDQFVGADQKFMTSVPYLGISARKIGEVVGDALHAEMQRRGWAAADTALCVVTLDELDTARDRTDGAVAALTRLGLAEDRIFKTPQKSADVPGAFDATNALLTQHGDVKHWLICGLNDNTVLGAVRAMEGRGLGAGDVVGIGINGTDCIVEFEKRTPTGFFASVLLSARRHGFETAAMLCRWVKDGVAPALDTRTTGVLITRDNFRQMLKEQGISDT
ncbi:MAG: arabinose ABC transporter substrate-binding protein [Planctomycetota bacterium]